MNKSFLSLIALCALSLVTSEVSAREARTTEDGQQVQRVHHTCGMCRKPREHCNCSKEVCIKEVPAVEEAPLLEETQKRFYCAEGTTEERDHRGHLRCARTIAHKEFENPLCEVTHVAQCPSGYHEAEVGKNLRRDHRDPSNARTKAQVRRDERRQARAGIQPVEVAA